MKRFFRVTLTVTFSIFAAMILVAGRSKTPPGPSTACNSAATEEKATQLVLYQNLPTPSIRQTNWSVPISPNLWGGASCALSLTDSPNTKYYCLVTVKHLTCTSYGTNGTKTYRWNSITGNTGIMNIMVPKNKQFSIKVEYYEPCGPYWTGSNPYGRGKWFNQQVLFYQSIINVNQWSFITKLNC